MSDMSREDALAHFGVKGMRWGVRKDDSGGRVTRKQNRVMNRDAAREFNSNKANKLYEEAKKGGEKVLVEVRLPFDPVKTITTGREFAQHVEAGGVFDVRDTEIFARQAKAGEQFVLNDQKIGMYKKQDFRKRT